MLSTLNSNMKTSTHFTLQAFQFFTDIPQTFLNPDDNKPELSRSAFSGLWMLSQILS